MSIRTVQRAMEEKHSVREAYRFRVPQRIAGHVLTGLLILAGMIISSTPLAAETLTGSVTNRTSNKPSAGDTVLLMDVSQGTMNEAGRTTTDAAGHYKLEVPTTGPHLLRVLHQGVTYNKLAPPGVPTADVEVYDVTASVVGVSVTADVMRIQANAKQLNIVEIIAVQNSSQPQQTQMSERAFEFYLPAGAKVDVASAQTPGGIPVNAGANPLGGGLYTIAFPLRPGETRFQVGYHLPYAGSARLMPRTKLPVEHFVVMLAPEMKFVAANPTRYAPPPPGSGFRATVQIATNETATAADLGFNISGTGTLPIEPDQPGRTGSGDGAAGADSGASGGAGMGNSDNGRGPGGGLGAPIDAPDPMAKYRLYVLGGFALVLGFGAVYIVNRNTPSTVVSSAQGGGFTGSMPAGTVGSGASSLLQVLKDELFLLEMERQQGKLSPQEYASAKAALDETLGRAIKRQG